MITKSQLTEKKYTIYSPGIYEWEVMNAEHIEGMDGKSSRLKLNLKFISPEDMEGKPLTTSVFYDSKLGDLISIGLGKSMDSLFGKDEGIDEEKLVSVLKGSFFKGRLGVKNGFNNIVEILPSQEEKI